MAAYLLIGCGIVALLMVVIAVGVYNRLVTLRNRFQNGYAQIDVQLKRRYELIPNLVETAKGYLQHERETLEAVITARNAASDANARVSGMPGDPTMMTALIGAETVLAGSLGKFMALAEAYPDLKANETMSQLMEELTSTENRIAFARQAYNDGVTHYNITREKFPNMLIAGPMGFRQAELFELQSPREA
ncbi:MAG: LemA family protein, partial [Phycisphaerae bacterium]